MFVRIEGCWRF